MKGIVLAGGLGSRLYPMTKGVSKQLLPIYDKPMIYYPISILLRAGIKEILIITTSEDSNSFKKLLGDGKNLGLNFSYQIQKKPEGLAQAFIIAEDFIGSDNVCMILGDNIFHGRGLDKLLQASILRTKKNDDATVFGYYVNNPERYGVISFDKLGKPLKIDEKPKHPKSNYAVIGLYFYPNSVIEIAKNIKPSARGELEITAINQAFLEKNKLNVEIMDRGYTWLDTGTHESLIEASNYVKAIETRQGLKIACLEEIVFRLNYISSEQLLFLAEPLKQTLYGQYLINIANNCSKPSI